MKFYSYTNTNKTYTKAVSLQNVRSIRMTDLRGKSDIRFGITIIYREGTTEDFPCLEEKESKKVYNEILKLLNEEDKLPLDK
jgi:hypothetical protein